MAKVSTKAFWSKDYTKALLAASNVAVEQAVLVVYGNQTAQEQVAEATVVDNGTGFTGADAEFGTSLAKQIQAGRTLSVKQMAAARRMALRYWGQFAEALNTERAEKGLDTVAPPTRTAKTERTPGRKAGTVDTSHLDPLFPDEEPQAITEYELFDGDEADQPATPEPTLRRLEDVAQMYGARMKAEPENQQALIDEMLATPEWVAFSTAMEDERMAWLLMVEVADGRIEGVTVKQASEDYRKAEAERERVLLDLGMNDAARKSGSYAAQWTQQGWSTNQGKRAWEKSPARTTAIMGLAMWMLAKYPGARRKQEVTA